MQVTDEMRLQAVRRAFAQQPRRIRLTEGQRRAIVSAARRRHRERQLATAVYLCAVFLLGFAFGVVL